MPLAAFRSLETISFLYIITNRADSWLFPQLRQALNVSCHFIMGLFDKIFRNTSVRVECPRCLGKGHVDQQDIKRLKKELKWKPASCAYCNGTGKVNPELLEKLPVDTSYLTVERSVKEYKKLVSGDVDALSRAKKFDLDYDSLIKLIKDYYLLSNWDTNQIANFLHSAYPDTYNTVNARQELIDYINLVIKNIEDKNNS